MSRREDDIYADLTQGFLPNQKPMYPEGGAPREHKYHWDPGKGKFKPH